MCRVLGMTSPGELSLVERQQLAVDCRTRAPSASRWWRTRTPSFRWGKSGFARRPIPLTDEAWGVLERRITDGYLFSLTAMVLRGPWLPAGATIQSHGNSRSIPAVWHSPHIQLLCGDGGRGSPTLKELMGHSHQPDDAAHPPSGRSTKRKRSRSWRSTIGVPTKVRTPRPERVEIQARENLC